MSEINLTERIIKTFLMSGKEIGFYADNDRNIGIKIDGESCKIEVSNYNVSALADAMLLSMARYLEAGMAHSERIDGGCVDIWHSATGTEKECPICHESVSEMGWRRRD